MLEIDGHTKVLVYANKRTKNRLISDSFQEQTRRNGKKSD